MITKRWLIFLFACSVLLIMCSTSKQDERKGHDAYLASLVSDKNVSGMAVAIKQNDQWVFSQTYGMANIAQGHPVNDTTLFHIMSITKQFVAVAVMQLAEKRLINIQSPIRLYLNQLPVKFDSVRVYQLLNHSSGIPDYTEAPDFMEKSKLKQTPEEVIDGSLAQPFRFAPGSKCEYSNTNYYLLGMLIEKISGTKLENYLTTHIFTPAGMHHTYLQKDLNESPLVAIGYSPSSNGWSAQPAIDPSAYWAAGGIVSTLKDMMKWHDALFTEKLVQQQSVNEMTSPVNLPDGNMAEYGYGFEILNLPDAKIAGHNGAGIGFNCSYLNFINNKISLIVLTNTSNSNSSLIAKTIFDLMTGQNGSASASQQQAKPLDQIDSVAISLLQKVSNNETLSTDYFINDEVKDDFEGSATEMIEDRGSFVSLGKQAEKVNPESLVRRYTLKFKNSETTCIMIFSKDGKVAVIKHK